MSRKQISKERKASNIKRPKSLAAILVVVVVLSAMIIPLLITRTPGGALRSFSSRYEIGSLANEDVFAFSSFEYVDAEQTDMLIEKAMAKVLPYFSFSLHATSVSVAMVQDFVNYWNPNMPEVQKFQRVGEPDSANVMARIAEMNEQDLGFMLSALEETSELVLQKGLFSQTDILKNKQTGYDSFYLDNTLSMEKAQTLIEQPFSNAVTKENLEQFLSYWLTSYTDAHPSFQPLLLLDTLRLLLEDNVRFNEAKTLHLRTVAKEEVKPVLVTIQRGQKLIAKDTVITEAQMALVSKMNSSSMEYTLLELIGRLVFVLSATAASLYVFTQFLKHDKRYYLYLNLMLASILFSLVGLYLISLWTVQNSIQFKDSFLPVLFAPIFISQITNKKRMGIISGFMLSSYVMILPYSSAMTFFFVMTTIGFCLYFFQFTIKRLEDIYNWFYACLFSSFMAIALNLLAGLSFNGVIGLLGALVVNISVSVVLVAAIVPLCERLFNIPTFFRLSELAQADDTPVLDRLAVVAQGTYNHSRYVADLAYNAAKAIGANCMLAKVGGIYHDIGKVDHPEYFIENQGTENKHDDIKPSLSVAIIKSHVKLGVEKGREAGLPQEVLDIIAQHHGNDVILFFYHEAKEQALASGIEVNQDDYSYTGN
ncbi:MAG: HDIG domain-containing metalloprotein, partial [Sphaerochaeta sp.]